MKAALLTSLIAMCAACSGRNEVTADNPVADVLTGRWSIASIDGRSLSESYEFNADGTMLYVVGGQPRRYSYRLVNDRLTIDRGEGITLNRRVDACIDDELVLLDTDVDIRILLKREDKGPRAKSAEAGAVPDLDEQLCDSIVKDADVAAIEKLLERGAGARHKSRFGVPAVVQAARNDRCDVIERLLDHGADVDARDDHAGMTALAAAVEQANLRTVACLLRRGADKTTRDRSGRDLAMIGEESPYDMAEIRVVLDDPGKADDLMPHYTRKFK